MIAALILGFIDCFSDAVDVPAWVYLILVGVYGAIWAIDEGGL